MRNNINLLPARPKIRQSLGPIALALIILGVVLIACLSGLYSYRRLAIIKTQERTEEVKTSIAMIKKDVQAVANVEARTLEIKKLYDEVIALENPHLSPAMFLAELKAKVPADVWLTSANVNPQETITINGVTYSYQSVARSVFSLESSNAYKDIKISSVTTTEDRETATSYEDFVITGALERRR